MSLEFLSPLKNIFGIAVSFWWAYLPVLLCVVAINLWLTYKRQQYLASLKWILLEIKPPPDVQKSPKIAENIFSGIHAVYIKPISFREMFFGGKVQSWFSFEIVGNGGDINFYVRTTEDMRSLIEAQFFAQYPEAEIKVVEDYVNQLPKILPNDEYGLFGTELVFTKDDAYPIKTYPYFEEEKGKDEFVRTDPLAPLAEIMSALEPGEHIWLQLIARGTGGEWVKKAQASIDKIVGKEPKVERDVVGKIVDAIDSLLPGGAKPAEEKKKDEPLLAKLTPGQRFVLEQVENKTAKLGFKAGYRFLYVARKDRFHGSHISATVGMFKQLYSNNLNSFKPNGNTITVGSGWFSWLFPSGKGFGADQEEYNRKYTIYQNYLNRTWIQQPVILNTEEMATLFHLPGVGVRAPTLPRVEAKRSTPPIGLPTR